MKKNLLNKLVDYVLDVLVIFLLFAALSVIVLFFVAFFNVIWGV
jgi:hypothetical protein